MDVCSADYKSESESITSFCESSKETRASGNPGGPFANDLGNQFTESLNIQNDEDSIDKENSNTLEKDGSEEVHANDTGLTDSEKCLIKSACAGMITPPSEGHKEQEGDTTAQVLACDAKSTGLPQSLLISLPSPLKVVSAIKGSREKQGKPPRKLSVTWAPDVYDPIPTSVSHVPRNGQRHRSDHKKNGKYKQKSNGKSSSRGSKGKDKDKKQSRKHGGSTKRSYHHLEDNHVKTSNSFHPLEDNITGSSELQGRVVDYDIGSTADQFCGSSFLKKSVTKLHFQVAEAT